MALKTFRAALLSAVVLSALANPWLGGFVALLVVVLAFLIAGWSFRLSHFGLVFVWDFLTRRCNQFVPDQTVNRVFLSRSVNRVPARSYGSLLVNAKGGLMLKYRPWLILPKRELVFPAGTHVVAKGLFYSEIARVENGNLKPVILLPPRGTTGRDLWAGGSSRCWFARGLFVVPGTHRLQGHPTDARA